MEDDPTKRVICWDVAVVDVPKVLCEDYYQDWIDQGCSIASERLNDHCESCDLCCTAENNFEYCPIGDSLSEAWLSTIEFTDEEGEEP